MIREECESGERQVEVMVTPTKGPAKRSEEKASVGRWGIWRVEAGKSM